MDRKNQKNAKNLPIFPGGPMALFTRFGPLLLSTRGGGIGKVWKRSSKYVKSGKVLVKSGKVMVKYLAAFSISLIIRSHERSQQGPLRRI